MSLTTAVLTTAVLVVAGGPTSAVAQSVAVVVYQVHAPLGRAAEKLVSSGFDVLEYRKGDNLFVLGDSTTGNDLKSAGFEAVVDHTVAEPPVQRSAADDETYYGGYRTLSAHWAHLDRTAQQRPDLATVVDYGDSWLKVQGKGGHDLRAICITKKNPGDCALTPDVPKPRFFVMGQLHSRELTTGDVAWRWIDHLVQGYGVDAEVTGLLDSTEVWVVPIANPDGVEAVQQGGDKPTFQRKNLNNTNDFEYNPCEGTSDSHSGVDLNRNSATHWGEEVGHDWYPCAQTYRGPSADSEPETKALQALWRQLYRDRRDTGAAPADTTGFVLSLHSYANLVLMPWSWSTENRSGNDAPMRQMAQDMSAMAGTGWSYGQSGQVLYKAFGTTDDWAYDDLGVASFVWEIGPAGDATCGGFFPAYSCQDSTFWPKLKPMLHYAAKKAANPYAGSNPGTTECARATNDTDMPIPDGGDFVSTPIGITDCQGNGRVSAQVEVHVKHTFRGDVSLDLVAPDGSMYSLRESTWDYEDDINATYTVDLSFENRKGTWQLRARDSGRNDTGHIDSWSLML